MLILDTDVTQILWNNLEVIIVCNTSDRVKWGNTWGIILFLRKNLIFFKFEYQSFLQQCSTNLLKDYLGVHHIVSSVDIDSTILNPYWY
jgi:hypothetical protein